MEPAELHKALVAPFTDADMEWKVQSCGKKKNGEIWARVVPYVSARAIQSRLDDVVGPTNWRNTYEILRNGVDGSVIGILCTLSIKDSTGEWVGKQDGAEPTDIEPFKGGMSNALKRAAVQWGIGRYLYTLPEGWAHIHEDGRERAKTKDNEWFNWDPPNFSAINGQQSQQQSAVVREVVKEPAQQANNGPAPAPAGKVACEQTYYAITKATEKPIADVIWLAGANYHEKLPLLKQALADLNHINKCAGEHAVDIVRDVAGRHGLTVTDKGRGQMPRENVAGFLANLSTTANGEVPPERAA